MCFLDFLTSVWVTEKAIRVGHRSFTQWPFHSWLSSLIDLTRSTGWVSTNKTIKFTSESLVALLIIAKTWWQWWDLATNMTSLCGDSSCWVSSCVSHSTPLICYWDDMYLLEVRPCHIWNLRNRSYSYNHQGQHNHNWFIISCCSCSCFLITSPPLVWSWIFLQGLVSYLHAIKKCWSVNKTLSTLSRIHSSLGSQEFYIFVSIPEVIHFVIIHIGKHSLAKLPWDNVPHYAFLYTFQFWHVHYIVSIHAYVQK